MRSGGKREGGEVRSFKSHSCPLHCRPVVLVRKGTVKINPTHDYIQSELRDGLHVFSTRKNVTAVRA